MEENDRLDDKEANDKLQMLNRLAGLGLSLAAAAPEITMAIMKAAAAEKARSGKSTSEIFREAGVTLDANELQLLADIESGM